MSLVRRVHHLRFAARNAWNMFDKFSNHFGFQFHCLMKHGDGVNLVLRTGDAFMMVSETGTSILSECRATMNPSNTTDYAFEVAQQNSNRERPFDIAFEVTDVQEVCKRVAHLNGVQNILVEPTTRIDYHGRVTLAVIKSCVDNVMHTIIDSSQYKGLFLPNFILPNRGSFGELEQRLHKKNRQIWKKVPPSIDHIAIAGDCGHIDDYLKWFGGVFGMKSIRANPQEDEIDGFIVEMNDTGMRLKACDTMNGESKGSSCKLVFVEPLKNSSTPNQVTRFLKSNGGPGIQHIGLAVDDITGSVETCKLGGAQFLNPPVLYYDQLINDPNFSNHFDDLKSLMDSGILLDVELKPGLNMKDSDRLSYILQIFTEPLFEDDGFFMELIERVDGATGFGAANIKALWKAVEATKTRQCNRMPSTR